ncbi:MAG: methylated-DNA--[protein]-cysteine S-methyltransferase [Propionibacteriales bacterium]|nr:methylated-DNA--[protein]-cysteine S-methyltransferase [Propionibacteriales bacterium]
MKLTTISTPDGPFTALVDDGAVLASGWTADPDAILARLPSADRPRRVPSVPNSDPDVAAIANAVQRYYGGELSAIDDVAVRQFGTALQLIGWQALREIPPGAPLSYTEFAAFVGRPAAVRAAAAICARNAPALFVPCHRVLRSDGSLGGFAWGVDVKRSLLEREGR